MESFNIKKCCTLVSPKLLLLSDTALMTFWVPSMMCLQLPKSLVWLELEFFGPWKQHRGRHWMNLAGVLIEVTGWLRGTRTQCEASKDTVATISSGYPILCNKVLLLNLQCKRNRRNEWTSSNVTEGRVLGCLLNEYVTITCVRLILHWKQTYKAWCQWVQVMVHMHLQW